MIDLDNFLTFLVEHPFSVKTFGNGENAYDPKLADVLDTACAFLTTSGTRCATKMEKEREEQARSEATQ